MDPGSFFPLALLIVIFYFMLIRPQQKRLKQHRALLASLQAGDEVLTIGGIYGVVRRLSDEEIEVEVADNTVVRFSRQAISRKVEEPASGDEPFSPEASEGGSPQ